MAGLFALGNQRKAWRRDFGFILFAAPNSAMFFGMTELVPAAVLDTALVFKLVVPGTWPQIVTGGLVPRSAVDEADGYMHLSGADTVLETARRHYSDAPLLLALGLDPDSFGDALKWEPAPKRDNRLFPHLFAPCPVAALRKIWVLERTGYGSFAEITAHDLPLQADFDFGTG